MEGYGVQDESTRRKILGTLQQNLWPRTSSNNIIDVTSKNAPQAEFKIPQPKGLVTSTPKFFQKQSKSITENPSHYDSGCNVTDADLFRTPDTRGSSLASSSSKYSIDSLSMHQVKRVQTDSLDVITLESGFVSDASLASSCSNFSPCLSHTPECLSRISDCYTTNSIELKVMPQKGLSVCNLDISGIPCEVDRFHHSLHQSSQTGIETPLAPRRKSFKECFAYLPKVGEIGAGMNREYFDMIPGLFGTYGQQITSRIFDMLSDKDIESLFLVGGSWRSVMEQHEDAMHRYTAYIKSKEPVDKENLAAKSRTCSRLSESIGSRRPLTEIRPPPTPNPNLLLNIRPSSEPIFSYPAKVKCASCMYCHSQIPLATNPANSMGCEKTHCLGCCGVAHPPSLHKSLLQTPNNTINNKSKLKRLFRTS